MNPDQTLIHSAYEQAIKTLYGKLFEAYAAAGTNGTETQQADQRFMVGVEAARSSRDRATTLLGQPSAAAGS